MSLVYMFVHFDSESGQRQFYSPYNMRMELIFDKIPFIIDRQYRYLKFPNQFIKEIAFSASPSTLRTYAYCILHWLQFCEDNRITWDTARQEHLLEYVQCPKLSPSTSNYRMRLLERFYSTAVAYGHSISFAALLGRRLLRRRVIKTEIDRGAG